MKDLDQQKSIHWNTTSATVQLTPQINIFYKKLYLDVCSNWSWVHKAHSRVAVYVITSQ